MSNKLKALFGNFSRKFNNALEAIHEQIDKLELSQIATKGSRGKDNEQESNDSNFEGEYELRQRRPRRNTKPVVIL